MADKRKARKKSLTDQQKSFVEEYLACWNAAEAARRAGYSAKTARHQASRLLTIANIRAVIDKRLTEKAMSADEVLARLTEIARADLRDILRVDATGNPTGFDLSPDKPLYLVKKVRIAETELGRTVSIELHDVQSALVKMGEYYKLFVQRHEVDVTSAIIKRMRELGLTADAIRTADPGLAEYLAAIGAIELPQSPA
jgi:hypothetical protein